MISKSELLHHLDIDLVNFTSSEFLTSDMTHKQAAALFLRKAIFKKFEDETSVEANAAAIQKFMDCNELCGNFSLNPLTTQLAEVVGEVKASLWRSFSKKSYECMDYSLLRIVEAGGTGPGASLGCQSYNFYTKLFDSTLSSTLSLLHSQYRRSTYHLSNTWHAAELARYAKHGDGIVNGNVLSTVPKNVDISRTICTEPPLNMFFQLGLGKLIEKRLVRDFNIRLGESRDGEVANQQSVNRLMAQEGSIRQNFATIDLSSASDTISIDLLCEVMPLEFLRLLQTYRSPTCRVGSNEVYMNMLSTMGNGFTFPLQTYLFATIVVACYRVLGISPKCSSHNRNFSVFGDDIIVKNDAFYFVCEALQMFGFIVNYDKSFSTGYFRESCGQDFYYGKNIRGFYIKSLKSQANINAVYNGLLLWQCRNWVLLPSTMAFLRKFCKNYVPFYEDPSSGFYSSFKRHGSRYKKLVPIPRRFSPNKPPYLGFYNPDGLLEAFVGGYVRNGKITIRARNPAFRYTTVFTHISWDDIYYTKRIYPDATLDWYSILEYLDEK